MMRLRRVLALVWASMLLAGCVSLGGDAPSRVWYVLEDSAGTRAPVPDAARTLRVRGEAGSDFYESRALAFSRERATRAYFQFANWSESPAERVARLFIARLREGDVSPQVGARSLRLILEDLYLDVSEAEPTVRLVIQARLEAGARGEPGAARIFRIDAIAPSADAAGMAQASGQALSRGFDQILDWLGGAL